MPYSDKNKQREYQKRYHKKTWDKRKSTHQTKKVERRNALAQWLKSYKQNLECISCGENHPACLDFHHINPANKDFSIGSMIAEGYAINTVMKELEKCIVLCRNCHAKKHYEQRIKILET